jgi:hypothetical protein
MDKPIGYQIVVSIRATEIVRDEHEALARTGELLRGLAAQEFDMLKQYGLEITHSIAPITETK